MKDTIALLNKLLGAKTLIERARLRTIGSCSYRGDMNLSLDTVRDLVVAMELIDEAMKFEEQDILLLTEKIEEVA